MNTNQIYAKNNSKGKSFIETAQDLVLSGNFQAISFDFFDTLMFRKTSQPTDIFDIVESRLIEIDAIPKSLRGGRFKHFRIEAERKSRIASHNSESNLSEIYDNLSFFTSNSKREEAKKIEIDVEKKNLVAIPPVLKLASFAYRSGKKIIIISDTYFTKENLLDFLPATHRHIFYQVFSSSDIRKGKATGSFQHVLDALDITGDKILHLGDNYIADIECAAKSDIMAHLLPNGTSEIHEIRDREKIVYIRRNQNERNGPYGTMEQYEIKASHNVPMSEPWSHFTYGMYVLGPILFGFCKWALDYVEETEEDTIFPLMREGYLLGKIINLYSTNRIKTTPLYLSRKVLFKASVDIIEEAQLRDVLGNNLASNPDGALDLFNISLTDLFPSKSGSLSNTLDINNNILIEKILSNRKIQSLARDRATELRNRIIKHIDTKIPNLTSRQSITLIDLGWNTTIQKLLKKILLLSNINTNLKGYYLMTTPAANAYEIINSNETEGFLINGGCPADEFKYLSRNLEILEQSCIPPFHGSVNTYLNDGKPVLSRMDIPVKQARQIKQIQNGILKYAQMIKDIEPQEIKISELYLDFLRTKLTRAMLYPTDKEISLFEDWHHDENLFNGSTRKILDSQILSSNKDVSPTNLLDISMDKLYWVQGSIGKVNQELCRLLMEMELSGVRDGNIRYSLSAD